MSRYDSNPFDEGGAAPSTGANFGGGSFYDNNPSLVAPVSTKKPLPLPPEPVNAGGNDATDEIPLGNSKTADLRKKERELLAKEEELKRKEMELKRREDAAARAGISLDEKNFPPFIPLIHHDIANDIPTHLQSSMRLAFYTWLGIMLCLVWNWLAVIIGWGDGGTKGSDGLSSTFLASGYVAAGFPLSYILWYKPLYVAMRKDAVLSFAWFFIFYAVHIGFCILAAVSPGVIFNGRSLTGIIPMLKLFADSYTLTGILYLVGFILWALEALVSTWVIKDVLLYFRGSGKAAELKRSAAREAVRAAV